MSKNYRIGCAYHFEELGYPIRPSARYTANAITNPPSAVKRGKHAASLMTAGEAVTYITTGHIQHSAAACHHARCFALGFTPMVFVYIFLGVFGLNLAIAIVKAAVGFFRRTKMQWQRCAHGIAGVCAAIPL